MDLEKENVCREEVFAKNTEAWTRKKNKNLKTNGKTVVTGIVAVDTFKNKKLWKLFLFLKFMCFIFAIRYER